MSQTVGVTKMKEGGVAELVRFKGILESRIECFEDAFKKEVISLSVRTEEAKAGMTRTVAGWMRREQPFKDVSSSESKMLIKLFDIKGPISQSEILAVSPSNGIVRDSLELLKQVGLVKSYTMEATGGEMCSRPALELTELGTELAKLLKEPIDLKRA